ncbi:hypothetical protein KA005_16490, partial [bacterium]|nr:hypothetical protein [bacterium]
MDLPIVKKIIAQGKLRRELLLGLILGLAATFFPIGCGIIEERDYGFSGLGSVQRWPRRPWSEAFVYQTPHYTVRTNTSPDVAVYIGKLMERA